ncbi:MAG: hypothetical protein M5R36_19180 [Deltaproteobacteria bacterium]|nr:hypothetical protein [Deltaproteobacteria bacterium]
MRDTYRLIRPKLWIVRNNVTRPARLDRFKTFFFSTLSLLFFLGLLYASVAFFQKLAAEEPFGMILVHKLVEFLFLTFFTVLVFFRHRHEPQRLFS